MKRTRLLVSVAAVATTAALISSTGAIEAKGAAERFDLVETSIAAIHDPYTKHLLSPKKLVAMYQARIAAYDGKNTATHLNSYIHVNTRAHQEAQNGEEANDPDGRQPL